MMLMIVVKSLKFTARSHFENTALFLRRVELIVRWILLEFTWVKFIYIEINVFTESPMETIFLISYKAATFLFAYGILLLFRYHHWWSIVFIFMFLNHVLLLLPLWLRRVNERLHKLVNRSILLMKHLCSTILQLCTWVMMIGIRPLSSIFI